MVKDGNIMKNTKIIFIRHGQSLGNAQLRFLGQTDLDLTELGYKQAEATAEFLKDEQIDVIYSSPLIRAYNTAVPHGRLRGIEVTPRVGLREIYCGDWEGMVCSDIEKKYGELYTVDWPHRFGTFVFPGGESSIDCGKRFYDAVFEIANENLGKSILIVAHGAVIRMFWAMISGILPEDVSAKLPFATNASVSYAEFDGERFIPKKYSVDSHLSGVGITSIKF